MGTANPAAVAEGIERTKNLLQRIKCRITTPDPRRAPTQFDKAFRTVLDELKMLRREYEELRRTVVPLRDHFPDDRLHKLGEKVKKIDLAIAGIDDFTKQIENLEKSARSFPLTFFEKK